MVVCRWERTSGICSRSRTEVREPILGCGGWHPRNSCSFLVLCFAGFLWQDYLSGQTCENALMETKKCSMEPCPSRDCKLSRLLKSSVSAPKLPPQLFPLGFSERPLVGMVAVHAGLAAKDQASECGDCDCGDAMPRGDEMC